jgi:ATP adenylyltransferase
MDHLWAGWRAAYLGEIGTESETGCLFCALVEADEEAAHIVDRGDHALTVMNLYPYTSGHVMVAPVRHVGLPAELSPDEVADIWRLLSRAQEAIQRSHRPDGFNLGANLGRAAGAGIPGHLHIHLVPRWAGDSNFMTAVASTRVLPEALVDTWDRIRSQLDVGGGSGDS